LIKPGLKCKEFTVLMLTKFLTSSNLYIVIDYKRIKSLITLKSIISIIVDWY
jgi:hypothetical protein